VPQEFSQNASNKVVLLNVVGLTPRLLKHAPRLAALGAVAPLTPPLPAVTSTCEASMITGLTPRDHGIVANGWFWRDLNEVWFWRPSNQLVSGERIWDAHEGTTAVLFWRFNMATSAAISVAERPGYAADGRKLPDIYTQPPELARRLQDKLGQFPLFSFWGPMSSIDSTTWIAKATVDVIRQHDPDLTMVYLPHLDYDLQRFGPDDARIPAAVEALDREAGRIIDAAEGRKVMAVSEYHIEAVTDAVMINVALREAGLLEVIDKPSPIGELLDTWRSRAFAVCDHQLAHVYVRDAADWARTRKVIEGLDGVDRILDKTECGLDHERSGELVVLAQKGRWFAYPYWLRETHAPDFARTVEIHRKPGYDPCELLLDPTVSKLGLAARLAKKTLGFRTVFDVVPLDTSMVGGSHGRLPESAEDGPILIGAEDDRPRDMTEVRSAVLRALQGPGAASGT
jgi:predicted AlkP superfamily pyrophosphatase or phosphodiesterase